MSRCWRVPRLVAAAADAVATTVAPVAADPGASMSEQTRSVCQLPRLGIWGLLLVPGTSQPSPVLASLVCAGRCLLRSLHRGSGPISARYQLLELLSRQPCGAPEPLAATC